MKPHNPNTHFVRSVPKTSLAAALLCLIPLLAALGAVDTINITDLTIKQNGQATDVICANKEALFLAKTDCKKPGEGWSFEWRDALAGADKKPIPATGEVPPPPDDTGQQFEIAKTFPDHSVKFGDKTATFRINKDGAKVAEKSRPFTVLDVIIGKLKRDAAGVLPASVSPGRTGKAEVTILPDLTGKGHKVVLKIDNPAGATGMATIQPPDHNWLTKNGEITVKGGATQTTPGTPTIFTKLIGQIDGNAALLCGESKFAVCAHPKEIKVLAGRDFSLVKNGTIYFGVTALMQPQSDDSTSNPDLLDQTKIHEEIENILPWPNPPFQVAPVISKGVNEPGNVPFPDDHAVAPEVVLPLTPVTVSGNGLEKQAYNFECRRCDVPDVCIGKSGFEIIFAVKFNPTGSFLQGKKEAKKATLPICDVKAGGGDPVKGAKHPIP